MSSSDPLLSLIRRVRRRWMLARAARQLVITTMVVAIAMAVMALTLRAVPMAFKTWHLAIAAAAVVGLVVLVEVVRRWPSDGRVARHIDAALELRELLASGLTASGDDAASRMVRAQALETASRTKPKDVPERFPSINSLIAAALLLSAALVANSLMEDPAEPEESGRRADFDPRRGSRIVHEDPEKASQTPPSRPEVRGESDRGRSGSQADEKASDGSSSEAGAASSPMRAGASPPRWESSENSDRGRSGSHENEIAGSESPSEAGAATSRMRAGASPPRFEFSEESDRGMSGSHENEIAGSKSPSEAGGASATTRAGASSPRAAISEDLDRRSGPQDTANDRGNQSLAAASVPDRHRSIIRAYFDADRPTGSSATRPGTPR